MADYSVNNQEQPLVRSDDSENATLIEKNEIGIRNTKLRWLALALACLTPIGSYFSFDNPQALQSALKDEMGVQDFAFDLLYSIYSFPNIILPFFGGVLIDKLGVKIALNVFPFILIIGQAIVTFGAAKEIYWVMVLGRFVFGLGGECLSVSQSSVIAKWFAGKELSFALGLTICVARLGSSLNSLLSPKIYNWTGDLYAPFLVGTFLCVFSWIMGIVLGNIDKKADDQEGAQNDAAATDKINLSDLKKFSRLYYLLLFNCFFLYGAFFGLTNNLNDIMKTRFGFSSDLAGDFIPIIYVCSAVITPLFGTFTDKKGKRVVFMLAASCLFFVDHIAIAFLKDTPLGNPNYGMVAILVGIGLFYSTYAAIFWPCVPLVVQENITGTAYGIISSVQNLMLSVLPLILGAIQKNTAEIHGGYFWTEILLVALVGCGIALTAWMYFEDMKKGGKLNRPGTEREKASALKSKARSFAHA